jgi:hypothetical protein
LHFIIQTNLGLKILAMYFILTFSCPIKGCIGEPPQITIGRKFDCIWLNTFANSTIILLWKRFAARSSQLKKIITIIESLAEMQHRKKTAAKSNIAVMESQGMLVILFHLQEATKIEAETSPPMAQSQLQEATIMETEASPPVVRFHP